MKEENFTKLIRLHELYRLTQDRRQKNNKRLKVVLVGVGLVALAFWSYSVFGKKITWKGLSGIAG